MKASINWLKEFVDFTLTPHELAHLLTMAGLEVEGMEAHGNDTVLEINVTPNRGDCLSILGIAREIAAITGTPIKKPAPSVSSTCVVIGQSIEIAATDLCERYASRIVLDIKVEPSPDWLTARLKAHGIRPVNNVVDVTNYVLLERGHPLHAFDLQELEEKAVVVKRANEETTFTTLDGVERKLDSDMLFIWDAEKPVAIAGIMGGLTSEVTQNTKHILIEGAYFDADSVRKTSKALNLKTEASYRFERGIDIYGIPSAIDRCAELLTQVIPTADVMNLVEVFPKKMTMQPTTIKLNPDQIRKIIGLSIPENEIETILMRLGFTLEKHAAHWLVTVPSFRNDIEAEIDLIEEIARIYSYDKIPSVLPVTPMTLYTPDPDTRLIQTVKDCMIKSGFSEAINYSFMNPQHLDTFKLPETDPRRQFISVKNPLKSEDEGLRTMLLPSLLNNLTWNLNRGIKSLQLFEISRVFLPSNDQLPHESHHLAAVLFEDTHPALYTSKHEPFYQIKGVVEAIFQKLRLSFYCFDTAQVEPYLRPGYSCLILVNGTEIGTCGELHPDVIDAYDIQRPAYVIELDIDKLKPFLPPRPTFQKLPKTPHVERDLALVVEKHIKAGDIQTAIKAFHTDLIESITLFDIYEGKPLPTDKKSLAYSIRYRAKDRTLTDSEIDSLQSDLIAFLNEKFKAELRT